MDKQTLKTKIEQNNSNVTVYDINPFEASESETGKKVHSDFDYVVNINVNVGNNNVKNIIVHSKINYTDKFIEITSHDESIFNSQKIKF